MENSQQNLAFCGQYTKRKVFTAGKGDAIMQNFDDFFTISGLHSCSVAM